MSHTTSEWSGMGQTINKKCHKVTQVKPIDKSVTMWQKCHNVTKVSQCDKTSQCDKFTKNDYPLTYISHPLTINTFHLHVYPIHWLYKYVPLTCISNPLTCLSHSLTIKIRSTYMYITFSDYKYVPLGCVSH